MNTVRETAVGLFVLIGLLCVAYLTIKLGKMEVFTGPGYELNASFDSVSGLRVGADIEMAGVPVGKVTGIRLDPDPMRNQAVVRLRFDKDLHLSDDSIASVRTSGLIGDKYILISAGGSGDPLKDGDEISDTEAALDLESMIGKFIFGKV